MTRLLPCPFIASSSTVAKPVGSILESGSVPRPPLAVSSTLLSLPCCSPLLTIYRALVDQHSASGLRVYIRPDDSSVYEDSLMSIARASDGSFKPTLILLGTRLGTRGVTPSYREAIKSALRLPQSVGIAGYHLLVHSIALTPTYLCSQWPTILLTLLRRHPGRSPLLPRSTHHTSPLTCFPLRGRHCHLSHTSSSFDNTRRHGSLHAARLPHPRRG